MDLCGPRQVYEQLSSQEEAVGMAVEAKQHNCTSSKYLYFAAHKQAVVTKYGAPHLRPTDIQSRRMLGRPGQPDVAKPPAWR